MRRRALVLFWSAVVLLCLALCVGVLAMAQGRWFLAVVNIVIAGWNIWLMGVQRRILDRVDL